MIMDIRAVGFELTDAINRHLITRMNSALVPFALRVQTVTARLEDVNADHGGIDKRCSLVATLRQRRTIVARAIDADLYLAIDEAAARIRRSVRKTLTRRIRRERKGTQRPGALIAL